MNIGRGDCVIELQHTEFRKKRVEAENGNIRFIWRGKNWK